MCDMMHSYVWRDSFVVENEIIICLTWVVYIRRLVRSLPVLLWGMSRYSAGLCVKFCDVWRELFIFVTWLIHACQCYCETCHDKAEICAWCPIMCDTTHSHTRHSYVKHDSSRLSVLSHTHMGDMILMLHIYTCMTRWASCCAYKLCAGSYDVWHDTTIRATWLATKLSDP